MNAPAQVHTEGGRIGGFKHVVRGRVRRGTAAVSQRLDYAGVRDQELGLVRSISPFRVPRRRPLPVQLVEVFPEDGILFQGVVVGLPRVCFLRDFPHVVGEFAHFDVVIVGEIGGGRCAGGEGG